MTNAITGAAIVGGVCGQPIKHSMSPVIHNAWIAAAGLDAAYVPFAPAADRFEAFVDGLRGGAVRGLNVTIPFKERALAVADTASDLARMAGAANLLVFNEDGSVHADNTDGPGLLGAIAIQAPGFDVTAAPVVILGAGGAARGAVAALLLAGAPRIAVVNRTVARAQDLADTFGEKVVAKGEDALTSLLPEAGLIINATSLGLGGGAGPSADLTLTPKTAVVMDMVYKPLRTEFLRRAEAAGRRTVDGLEMLLRQAIPTFEAIYGQAPSPTIDVRVLALKLLGEV
ncbi:shikimate dehydrogenase [Caulobacter vibrioides]|uniref:shikimate dehydrogenase n=1 Tax=Caulobacter vibrioides TaxID=155892 RepID=UPI000BB4E1D6|nr:shikimate dehydrogenase [Caulobacter vibrioides]ATC23026.1 shikimate dehydrogenase [Caulobacter vibrioides]AZH11236.1 shikimate dehydrogenase [Caulobacter vibrioides]PLR12482.1 shikimate dehydrogenase [Caulobacter vibrioides]